MEFVASKNPLIIKFGYVSITTNETDFKYKLGESISIKGAGKVDICGVLPFNLNILMIGKVDLNILDCEHTNLKIVAEGQHEIMGSLVRSLDISLKGMITISKFIVKREVTVKSVGIIDGDIRYDKGCSVKKDHAGPRGIIIIPNRY